jgi:hypothetical protein
MADDNPEDVVRGGVLDDIATMRKTRMAMRVPRVFTLTLKEME